MECRCLQAVHVDGVRHSEGRASLSSTDPLTYVGDAFLAAQAWLPLVAMVEGFDPSLHTPQGEALPSVMHDVVELECFVFASSRALF